MYASVTSLQIALIAELFIDGQVKLDHKPRNTTVDYVIIFFVSRQQYQSHCPAVMEKLDLFRNKPGTVAKIIHYKKNSPMFLRFVF